MLVLFFYKVSFKEFLNYNKYILLFFITVITFFNLILSTVQETLLIDIRIILACNLTYALRFILPTYKLINALEIIFTPLKLLKINTTKLSIILNIGINFIPILTREINTIENTLIAKGIYKNAFYKIKYISKLILPIIFKKVQEIETSLKAKNYVE